MNGRTIMMGVMGLIVCSILSILAVKQVEGGTGTSSPLILSPAEAGSQAE